MAERGQRRSPPLSARIDQLGMQLAYSTYRIRREMAELLVRRADELRKEDDQNEQERKKARRRDRIGFFLIIAGMLACRWYTGTAPLASLRHNAS